MNVITKENAIKASNSDKCNYLEYSFNDLDIDFSVAIITGRYPNEGYCFNCVSKELIYILDGAGKLCFENSVIEFTKGDAILIDNNEKYYWETDFCKVTMSCTPAWTEDQHKLVK